MVQNCLHVSDILRSTRLACMLTPLQLLKGLCLDRPGGWWHTPHLLFEMWHLRMNSFNYKAVRVSNKQNLLLIAISINTKKYNYYLNWRWVTFLEIWFDALIGDAFFIFRRNFFNMIAGFVSIFVTFLRSESRNRTFFIEAGVANRFGGLMSSCQTLILCTCSSTV